MDRRKFAKARRIFADVVRDKPSDTEALYLLAAAAYYSGDPKTADAALGRLRALKPDAEPAVVRASALTLAALDESDEARSLLTRYAALEPDPRRVRYVERRLTDWEFDYRNDGDTQLAQEGFDSDGFDSDGFNSDGFDSDTPEPEDAVQSQTDGNSVSDFADTRMVLVDVTIIGTEENETTSMGVNLLNGLQLQFGETLTPTPGVSWSRSKTTDAADPDNNENLRTVTRMISIPSITYSLNIANAMTARNDVIARPTLVALSGQTSTFFSGSDVSAAAVSSGSGDSVSIEKKIGVKLAVTPEFLGGDRVRLQVTAERTFLTTPSSSVVFQFRLDTSVTEVTANVVMRLDETLVLSGLTEKENEGSRDGVPFLQDIPGLQYLFSEKNTNDFRKSVLILLTPRSPHYTSAEKNQAEGTNSQALDDDPEIVSLEKRFADWFRPHPHRAAIVNYMKDRDIPRDFRTGDIPLEDWPGMDGHRDRLKQALDFLYF
jgi:general secretion pathway protein D